MKTIVICSGGLDSVSLAHMVAAKHELLGLLSFDYGHKHRKEVTFAAACAAPGATARTPLTAASAQSGAG